MTPSTEARGPSFSGLTSDFAGARPHNRLLQRIPADEFAKLRAHLRTVPVKVKHVFYEADAAINHVFFPNSGVVSLTSVMHNGAMVETATIGSEGMVGMEVFLGGDRALGEVMLQVGDASVEVLPSAVFRAEMQARGALFEAVQRYSQGLMTLMMQSAACLALHEVQQRCCRWLLMTQDRVRSDSFDLSHEFLAMMLGATRPTVTVVAGSLQKSGLIAYKRGRISILDRKGLQAASCECYATVRGHFDRLGL